MVYIVNKGTNPDPTYDPFAEHMLTASPNAYFAM